MALNIRDAQVEKVAADVAHLAGETRTEAVRQALLERKRRLELHRPGMDRASRALAYLEREVWPFLPPGERGRTLSKAEEEELLGLGPDGV